MMLGAKDGQKLDLSRLSDEEAKHVWEVIQRDFDLRKKEEDRLGELKTKIEKEDAKRELLGVETNLTESHCIRCLHPFKFLVNSKRQCLDCQLFACKACCRYSKKEHGWVCDSCCTARILKIGTLDWYHENVRARFKRFGSAKVMRSLYKRLNGMHGSQPDLRGARDEDTHSMPEVRGVYDGHPEDYIDGSDAHRYRLMRKTKRLLSVHPLDFDMDNEYATVSRRQSLQYPGSLESMTRRRSMMAEADVASVFQQILEEQASHEHFNRPEVHLHVHRRKSMDRASRSDEGQFGEHRMMRTRSLSKMAPPNGPQRHYFQDMDSSEEEEGQRAPMYQLPARRRSRASSQESVQQPPPQINDLNKRMSAIESLLNRLEEKMTVPPEQPACMSEAEQEERKLRKKLNELTGNISDKGLSSEDEDTKKAPGPRGTPGRSATRGNAPPPGPLSSRPRSAPPATSFPLKCVYPTAGKPLTLDKKQRALSEATQSHYSGTTDSELSELEDKVAWAAAKVHNTESEMSDIENRIAALSAAGMSVEKSKKRPSGTHQRKKAPDVPLRQADLFLRNSIYRGSLTQRNPVAKDKPKASNAKPVLAQAL
ncbi:hypothetical protein COCON_G00197880 [Conger conger]|uniref:RabBD domain-containing protein n=1 Tax=Conger conger TaxID=82655 RepID=A0A9Q1D1U7_CONCO|nr:hypothetical protein COCON_G00197880 [Conger conger]